jgi:type IV pilus assembly protein PilA
MFNLAQLREERKDGDKGFTLIELLVVVVIIGILIAIAIPLYLNYKKGANDKAAASDVRNAISTLETCNADNNAYPSAVTSAGAITGCSGQTINLSSGTSIKYTSTTPFSSYILVGTNSGGNPKFYCYNSGNGGSVASVAGPLASATC